MHKQNVCCSLQVLEVRFSFCVNFSMSGNHNSKLSQLWGSYDMADYYILYLGYLSCILGYLSCILQLK